MKKKGIPSIKFIAEMSHCSPASVSNVINGKRHVGERTKALILENIRKYNYRVNHSAHSLRVRKSETIAVYFRQDINLFKSEFYLNVMFGLHKRIVERGFDLLLREQKSGGGTPMPNFIVGGRADAVIMMNSAISDDMRKMLGDYKTPALMLDAYSPDIDSIVSDGFSATGEIVSYLYRMKHSRMGYFAYDKDPCNSEMRMAGFIDGAKKSGISRSCKNYGSFQSEEEALSEFEKIISRADAPTAIIACNDHLACSLMRRAQDLGFSVPDDISFFGYGDILLSEHCHPRLSTVHVDAFSLGLAGADMIIKRMENPDRPVEKVVLPVKLTLRDSAGTCRKK